MQSFTLKSSSKQFSRKTWYLSPAAPPTRIAIFLDAEYYIDQMETPAIIERLINEGNIAPLACLFVSSHDPEARHHDFTCSDPYADFIAKDLVPWMKRQSGTKTAGDHLIAGVSLSGLQAVYTSLSYPLIFAATLCQSGSFWWEQEWLLHHLDELTPNPGKYWLSVGTREHGAGLCHAPTDLLQEIDQDVAIRRFSEALKQHGSEVKDHLYEGGHDSSHWRDELPDALRWLLKK